MKYPLWLVSGLFVFVCSLAPAVERLPIEDFTREPVISMAQLSPDGKHLAFMAVDFGVFNLYVSAMDGGKRQRMDFGLAPQFIDGSGGEIRKGIERFAWVGDQRLVASTTSQGVSYGVLASNLDGTNTTPLRGKEIPFQKTTAMGAQAFRTVQPEFNDVQFLYAFNDPYNNALRWRGGRKLVGTDAASHRLVVANLTPEKRVGLFVMPPSAGLSSEPLLSDPEYDIIPQGYTPAFEGLFLSAPIISKRQRGMIGIRYYNETPQVKWLDQNYAGYQAAVDKALPNAVNVLVNESSNGRKLLWFSFSDRNPGGYHLLDLEAKAFTPLDQRMPWIKAAQMAPMLSIKYPGRDGLVIHGYLTVPVGYSANNLPLVVMPHGDLWGRDTWGFSPLVQLLANRGYAVLQMNYRGSSGYGQELYQQAKHEIGGKIQDDIEDATRWAIATGLADPKRIAILGREFGGYSALFALGHSAELYRCGISFGAVTDWPAIFGRHDKLSNKLAIRHWLDQDEFPDKDGARLRSISPISFADKIIAPVLIIHGKDDKTVPVDQAKRMVVALEKAGRKPTSLLMADLDHGFGNEKQRAEIFKSIIDFLEKNLGPGVP